MSDKLDNRAKIIKSAGNFRRKLHKQPELSGREKNTIQMLREYFKDLNPDKFHTGIGGNSIAFEFSPQQYEKTLVFRADMDALPIHDEINTDYRSEFDSIGHKCGHDGHMAILSAFSAMIPELRPVKTRLIILFQAEEETGQGAEKVVNSDWYKKLMPDFVFGLHNLPGFKSKTIILREKIFASSSVGMIIKLTGKSSHAGQPEDGITPAPALAKLINFVQEEIDYDDFHNFCLATIIHIKLGDIAFGTSPGKADFMLTLRAADERDLEKLIKIIKERSAIICNEESLIQNISYTEKFPSTVNHADGTNIVREAAAKANLEIQLIPEAFRWSEDFGHYLKHSNGAFFGIGAGLNTPRLHNPDYDFPDEIIEAGMEMFLQIFMRIDKN